MTDWWKKIWTPVADGSLAALCTAIVAALIPVSIRESVRKTLDQMLAMAASVRQLPPPGTTIAIIDIDAASLDAIGPWPWPRNVMAKLVDAVGSGVVFSGTEHP